MASHHKDPFERSAVSLGMNPEVKHAIKQFHLATAQPGATMQDSIRELILRGGGVECDEAMLAIQRRRVMSHLERFALKRLIEMLRAFEEELRVYCSSMPHEGDE